MDFSHLYYKPGGPASFSSLARLYKHAKKENPKVKKQDVKEYLEKQYTYSRHFRLRKHFPRRKCLFLRIDETWAADLIEISSLSSYNGGYNYICNVIDCFSRKMWARSLKQKTNKEVEMALRSIIESNQGRSPYRLWTDLGSEFLGPPIRAFYEEQEILRYSVSSPLKSMIVERANASLENLLYKMMTSLQTAKWTHLLADAVAAYNARVSRSLHGLSPDFAHEKRNEKWLRQKFLEDYKKHKEKFKNRPPSFKIGDFVRVSKNRRIFERGYEPTTEIPTKQIVDVLRTYPITYRLSGGNKRAFYAQELVKVKPIDDPRELGYFIERERKINTKKLRSGKVSGGQIQYLLKSKNDSEQSSWISEAEREKLIQDGLLK